MNMKDFYTFRLNMNLTQEELAHVLGLTRVTIYNYESGKYPIPKAIQYAMKHLYDWGKTEEEQ